MKYLLVLLMALTGCASISEYNQGCREGLRGLPETNPSLIADEESIVYYCTELDANYRREQRERKMQREPRIR